MSARWVFVALAAGGAAGALMGNGLGLCRIASACAVLGLAVLAAAAAVVVTTTRRERRVNERLAAEHEQRMAHRRAAVSRAGGRQLAGAARAPHRDTTGEQR